LVIWFGGPQELYIGLGAHLLGLSIITFAILRYDLPDIRRLALTWLRLALLTAFTVILYLAILLMVGWVTGTIPDPARFAYGGPVVLLALLLAALLDVILSPRLHQLFDRAFLGYRYDIQTALRTYSQQISLILDLERLADTTLDWLNRTMRIRRCAFILIAPHGEEQVELQVLQATFDPESSSRLFNAESRFIVHFRRFGRPLPQYDLDMLSWFQAMPGDERQWLQGLAVDLYVPVLAAEQPVALLALGPKAGRQPYSDEDLETLIILAGQTGAALENARLLDNLRAVQDDLQQLNMELAETNRQLQRLDATKADFIAIASHELRTPLTQIYGYSDVLSSLTGDELGDAQELNMFIEGISRGASRLKRVVDAMVDVSLIETGGLALHCVTLPLGVIVQNAVETIQPGAEQRNLTLTVKDMSDLPYIQADSARLEQVFVGLLSNAIKFSPDDSEIVISGNLDTSSPDEPFIEMMVADRGIGIDPDQQDLIFDKFYRGESAMLHSTDDVRFKGAGPGLGLAIAKGIVDAHGGRLWVESPGRDEERCPGSTFHVRLPVSASEKE
jgi:signal transduction histidine kinase